MEDHLPSLIKGCLRGDRKSQHELYKLYYSYGMGVCIRYVNNEYEAIQIVNEGFMKVFDRLDKYDNSYDFKPWFRKIMVNTAIDYLKKQKSLDMNLQLEEAENVESTDDILSKIGYKELITMVQALSSAYRTVFNMYVIDGYKHEEIASKLNISIGTSKSNLFKARAILQEKISQQLTFGHV